MTDRRLFLKMAAAFALIANKAYSQPKTEPDRMMVVNGLGGLFNPNTSRTDQSGKPASAILAYSRLSAVMGSTWAARMAGAAAAHKVTIIVNSAAAP